MVHDLGHQVRQALDELGNAAVARTVSHLVVRRVGHADLPVCGVHMRVRVNACACGRAGGRMSLCVAFISFAGTFGVRVEVCAFWMDVSA